MSKNPIKGKVARILNARELVLNIGSEHGVAVGMRFRVLDPKGEDIKDPDTGHLLGSLRRTKLDVEVTSVQARLCVASTFKKREMNVGGRMGLGSSRALSLGLGDLAELLAPPKHIVKYETLRAPENVVEPLDEKDSFVKTGDVVEELIAPVVEADAANKALQPTGSASGEASG